MIDLNVFKKLASQTAVYGLSSVLGRFLNYLLVPLYTYSFAPAEYGVVAEFYAYMGFLSVLLAFGMETGYFRFRNREGESPEVVFATVLRFLLVANLGFFLLILALRQPLAEALHYPAHSQYLWWVAAILALDAIGSAAFARLRAEERALRFALVKLVEIVLNIGLNLLFIVWCRRAFLADPGSLLGGLWNPALGIGYVFLANLAASTLKLVLLAPELRGLTAAFDGALLGRLVRYSLPMVLIGFAGIINEMLDRAALKFLLPYDPETNLAQLGIYAACYKLSVLMTLFIQAFRYAGEPFFFAYAGRTEARRVYARILDGFTMFCVFLFLLVSLYLDFFQHFIGAAYREGLSVVPVLLLANLLLGIYVNLSIWYKLTDRTLLGAWVALLGSVITVIALLVLVPHYGYLGAAWAHLFCYGAMVALSYGLGQRYYPVPYRPGRVLGQIGLGLGLFALGRELPAYGLPSWAAATLCLGGYVTWVWMRYGRALWHR